MCSDDHFVFTLFTNDATLATRAARAGVDRIGVDLDWLGKEVRQPGADMRISHHHLADLDVLAPCVGPSALFARLNPLHAQSPSEVDEVIERGVSVVMAAMVNDGGTAARFVELVAGRATVVLLLEHVRALENIAEIVAVEGVDEVHIGLNDLALSLGLANRWLALLDERFATACAVLRQSGRRFGLAGIGKVDDATLPVASRLVYAQYARTGATAALLARSFFRDPTDDLTHEVAAARQALCRWRAASSDTVAAAHRELAELARTLATW
jgi:hypothetical protein